ncbi:MAG TPA: hypothetical protein VF043_37235 [Ktedonobacteraceae bacterium]
MRSIACGPEKNFFDLAHLATRPERLWHGKIESGSRSRAIVTVGFCYVKILDAGYEEMPEIVFFDQIVEIKEP